MAARRPLYVDGTDLREMSSAQITAIQQRCVYLFGGTPSVVLTRVSSSGSLSGMIDTRLQAGAAQSRVERFPTQAETAEPSQVSVTRDHISETVNTISAQSDTNNKFFPVYYNGTDIQAMTATDFFDTFITQAIDLLVDGNDRDGTFKIHTGTSLSNHTLISSSPVFTDTRANTGAYTAGGIGETLDQPTTITNYYLFRTNQGTSYGTPTIVVPAQVNSSNDIQTYTATAFDAMLLQQVSYYASHVANSTIRYSINGSGSNRGSGMVDTRLTGGSGNYQQRFVNANDYRAQEFPNGTASTISTYFLRIRRT